MDGGHQKKLCHRKACSNQHRFGKEVFENDFLNFLENKEI